MRCDVYPTLLRALEGLTSTPTSGCPVLPEQRGFNHRQAYSPTRRHQPRVRWQGRNSSLLVSIFLFLLFSSRFTAALFRLLLGKRVSQGLKDFYTIYSASPTAAHPMHTSWSSGCCGLTSEHPNHSKTANRSTRRHSKGQRCCKRSSFLAHLPPKSWAVGWCNPQRASYGTAQKAEQHLQAHSPWRVK